MEEWRGITGYEGLYEVSNLGNIRSLNRIISVNNNGRSYKKTIYGHYISPVANSLGYLQVGLSTNGVVKRFYIHRLVYLNFIGEIPENYEINHINHIKTDNNLTNLEIVTKSENGIKRSVYYGTRESIATKNKKCNCNICGKFIDGNKTGLCRECYNSERGKHIPHKSELLSQLKNSTYVSVGRKYGVSDKTIKKWIERK